MNPKIIAILFVIFGVSGLACSPRHRSKINRQPEAIGVDSLFLERWSPRAMSGQMVSDDELKALFEAARWAPSCFNEQPWRFVYAKKGTSQWDIFMDFLVPFNQEWCANGSVLCVMISKKNFTHNGNPNDCHSFDMGAAWENLALQGHMKGLVVHGMGGFDYEKVRSVLNIPDDFQVEAMCVIGKPADRKVLSKDLQAMEKPSDRKALHGIISEGTFDFKG